MPDLETIEIAQPWAGGTTSVITLERGDILSARGADVLVVSAFAGNYQPTRASLIGQLARHTPPIDVGLLQDDPAEDLRGLGRTWLSRALPRGAPAERILCFESPDLMACDAEGPSPLHVIDDLFRGLNTALIRRNTTEGGDATRLGEVLSPIVGTGDQGFAIAEILPEFLRAATDWILQGVPLGRLRIFVHDRVPDGVFIAARQHFCNFRKDFYARQPPIRPAPEHDLFLSYARRDSVEADFVTSGLRVVIPGIRIWRDVQEIGHGENWRSTCFGAVDQCRMMLCLLSSNYAASRTCTDEFTAGWARQNALGHSFLFPVEIYSHVRPTYVDMLMRCDCAELDAVKLADAYAQLARCLKA